MHITDHRCRRALVAVLAIAVTLTGATVGSGAVTKVYSSGPISVPIGPELSPGLWLANTSSAISVPDVGSVVSVKVRVRLDHPADGDIDVSLGGPGEDAPIVTLAGFVGGSGDNFGSGSDCSGTFTVFDDAASSSITAGTPPFAGSYRPEEALSAFAGSPVGGEWRLLMLDFFPFDTGRLLCWELELTYEPPAADLRLQASGNRTVKPGKKITYTLNVVNKGPGVASGATLVDRLPRGTTFLGANAGEGSCAASGRQVRCELGDIAKDESRRVTIVARAPRKTGRITNVATVSAAETDPVPGNDQARTATVVKR